jgi:hypothetical protein
VRGEERLGVGAVELRQRVRAAARRRGVGWSPRTAAAAPPPPVPGASIQPLAALLGDHPQLALDGAERGVEQAVGLEPEPQLEPLRRQAQEVAVTVAVGARVDADAPAWCRGARSRSPSPLAALWQQVLEQVRARPEAVGGSSPEPRRTAHAAATSRDRAAARAAGARRCRARAPRPAAPPRPGSPHRRRQRRDRERRRRSRDRSRMRDV